MKRLTKEQILNATANKYFIIGGRIYGKTMWKKMTTELLEYKKIEEQFGIDLITLFNALKQDWVYRKDCCPDRIIKCSPRGIEENGLRVLDEDEYYIEDTITLEYEEFGKTWALTKEELEK